MKLILIKKIIHKIFVLSADGYTNYQIAKKFDIPAKTVANIIENPTYVSADEKSAKYLESLGYSIYGDLNGLGFLPYNRRCKKNGRKESNSKKKFVATSFHEPIVSSDIWIDANKNVRNRGKENVLEYLIKVSYLIYQSVIVVVVCLFIKLVQKTQNIGQLILDALLKNNITIVTQID